jgi:predicted phage replisome organizer
LANKKYYWLKLKKDFFKRHDIQIIEAMPNGKDYLLFYLKLLVESVDHDGQLRFSDTIPYDENMLSTISNTNIDIVRSAMKVFTSLKMIDILEDNTIFMNEVEKMLGTETYWAEQKRKQRQIGQCPKDVQLLSNVSNQEIDIELDKDIEKDIDIDNTTKVVSSNKLQPIIDKWNSLNLSKVIKVQGNRLKMLNARVKDYGMDEVIRAIENINSSSFLKGQNNKSWTITFDWLVKPNNFIKVLEGNYSDKGGNSNYGSVRQDYEPSSANEIDFSKYTG